MIKAEGQHAHGESNENHQNPRRKQQGADDDAVEELLASMSLEDKVGQMSQVDVNELLIADAAADGGKRLDVDKATRYLGEMGVGSVLNLASDGAVPWTAAQYRALSMQLQQIAKDHGRPPIIWGLDSVHGANYVRDATWAPSPLNLAATFDRTHARTAGEWASQDTRAAGITWLFSPLLGLALHSSFARVYETFGEDPYVVGQLASAMIQGIENSTTTAVSGFPSRTAACAKHFVGYPLPRTGHDRAPSWIPTRHLYQYFVLPWKTVMKETNVQTVMESYTETDGVPNVANPQHLRYLLRYRLQFDGVLVTDYEEINNLHNWHHIVKEDPGSVAAATEYALQQGTVDMSMIPKAIDGFVSATVNAVQSGKVAESRIDESARRVLRLKHNLCMMEEEMTVDNAVATTNEEPQALEMAQDSLILTENRGNLLPLQVDQDGLKLLVTGPTANSRIAQSGGWTVAWQGATDEEASFTTGSTVYQAFLSQVGVGGVFTEVSYRCGTDFLGEECIDDGGEVNDVDSAGGNGRDLGFLHDVGKDIGDGISKGVDAIGDGINDVGEWVGLGGDDGPHSSIERAVDAAKDVDLVVICIGEEAYAEKPGDIRSLDLPVGQLQLVQAMRASYPEKPLLLVYFGGRPRLLKNVLDLCNAVIVAFLPGPHAGEAIVNLVTGAYSPNGRLPITYPAFQDGGGVPYFHTVSDQCTKGSGKLPHYEYAPCTVQWPFGHGLAYSKFEYSNLVVSGSIQTGINVQVDVKNTGAMAAKETVMVFTFDDFRLTTPEQKRLRSFQKEILQPNQGRTFSFDIPSEDFKFVGPHDDRHYILDARMSFWVGIGPSTDCRADPSSALCAHVEGGQSASLAACQSACELWVETDSHDCALQLGLSSMQECLSLCEAASNGPVDYASVGKEGWGWNYVDCLESVVWGFQRTHGLVDCSTMTALCRDIFRTGGIDEFGLGSSVVVGAGSRPPQAELPQLEPTPLLDAGPSASAIAFALVAGLVATVLILMGMRGQEVLKFASRKRRSQQEEPRYPSVEMYSKHRGAESYHGEQDQSSFNVMSTTTELLGRIEQHKKREFIAVASS